VSWQARKGNWQTRESTQTRTSRWRHSPRLIVRKCLPFLFLPGPFILFFFPFLFFFSLFFVTEAEQQQNPEPVCICVDAAAPIERHNSTGREDFECRVCQDLMVDPCTLHCGHTCCRTCLFKWLRASTNVFFFLSFFSCYVCVFRLGDISPIHLLCLKFGCVFFFVVGCSCS